MMDRSDWLKPKRRLAETRMDTLFVPIYDEHYDVLELVFPEDWPLVLSNFCQVLNPASYLFRLIEEEVALFEDGDPKSERLATTIC